MSAISRHIFMDPGSGLAVQKSVQDIEPILELNAALRNADKPSNRLRFNGDERWYRVATIPNILIEKYWKQGINFYQPEGWEWWKKNILNNSDYEKLRSLPGRI